MVLQVENSVRVLVIEGHDHVRHKMLQRLRRRFPYLVTVGTTSNAEEGYRQVGLIKPDVVLIDSRLNGVELCRRISQNYPDVRSILLTNYHDEAQRQAALDAGAAGYYIKHIDCDHLLRYIKEAIDLKPLRTSATRKVAEAMG